MTEAEVWASGAPYERYVGRWSRLVARRFLDWLAVPAGAGWLDVGCGTGALTEAILEIADPALVHGVDPSQSFIAYAARHVRDVRARFSVGDAQALPAESRSYDAVVSGLVLNFVGEPGVAVAEMARVTRSGGVAAAYVWDYAEGMQMMRYFWDAAVALDAAAFELDEGNRFTLCRPEPLVRLFQQAGLEAAEVRSLEVDTRFRDFDEYWSPFLGGQAPAPSYAMALSEGDRRALRERLSASLPRSHDGSIELSARAWAVRGVASR